jgi:hypothetical protein
MDAFLLAGGAEKWDKQLVRLLGFPGGFSLNRTI